MNDNKLKTLVVPMDLAKWFGKYVDMIGDDSVYFYIIDNLLKDYHSHDLEDETRRFVYYNMMEISEVISGKREYAVETE